MDILICCTSTFKNEVNHISCQLADSGFVKPDHWNVQNSRMWTARLRSTAACYFISLLFFLKHLCQLQFKYLCQCKEYGVLFFHTFLFSIKTKLFPLYQSMQLFSSHFVSFTPVGQLFVQKLNRYTRSRIKAHDVKWIQDRNG